MVSVAVRHSSFVAFLGPVTGQRMAFFPFVRFVGSAVVTFHPNAQSVGNVRVQITDNLSLDGDIAVQAPLAAPSSAAVSASVAAFLSNVPTMGLVVEVAGCRTHARVFVAESVVWGTNVRFVSVAVFSRLRRLFPFGAGDFGFSIENCQCVSCCAEQYHSTPQGAT